jgi:hypothetical protein
MLGGGLQQATVAVRSRGCRRVKLILTRASGGVVFTTIGPPGALCRSDSALLLKAWSLTK